MKEKKTNKTKQNKTKKQKQKTPHTCYHYNKQQWRWKWLHALSNTHSSQTDGEGTNESRADVCILQQADDQQLKSCHWR